MANTTNFNWETPDDTDLVKDGAAAIRTLGSAIDTSLVDLKGGTTGQVLAKNSNTDMDFIWSADASGIPATIFDAKGDLIVASAADTAARLAVGGTNGHVLTVNSGATNGIEWAAVASGGMTSLATGSLASAIEGASITSISGSYNHLQLIIYAYSLNVDGALTFRFNTDSGSNYSMNYFDWTDANPSVFSGYGLTGGTSAWGNYNNYNDAAATGYVAILDIYNYADTNMQKQFQIRISDRNASNNQDTNRWVIGRWKSTSAITSVQIRTDGTATFDAGSYILYGVK